MVLPINNNKIRSQQYWINKLSDAQPLFTRGATGAAPRAYRCPIDREVTEGVTRMANGDPAAEYVIYSAVLGLLTGKCFNRNQFLIASPGVRVGKRQYPAKGLLFQQFQTEEYLTLRELIGQSQRELQECLRHPYHPRTLEKALADRQADLTPALDIGLRYQPLQPDAAGFDRVALQFCISGSGNERRELEITAGAAPFDEASLALFGERFIGLLKTLRDNLHTVFGRIDVLTPREKHLLLHEFTATDFSFPAAATLVSLFERTQQQYTTRTAVSLGDTALPYGALNQDANRVAAALRQRGVRPNDRVGLVAGRSVQTVAALLGILKAGAAYVPLDPDYPAARIHHLVRDSGVQILLTPDARTAPPPGTVLLSFEEALAAADEGDPGLPLDPSGAAYVIYTSGSTGLPKGVAVAHGAFINMIRCQIRTFAVTPADKVLQFASLSFDASVSEIFMALLAGAELMLIDKTRTADPDALIRYLNDKSVSVATLPPALLPGIRVDALRTLRCLISAGESAPPGTLVALAKKWDVYNAYGPTECAVCATIHKVSPREDAGRSFIPIGRPIDNTRIYLLDDQLQLTPLGLEGEICISGRGVADGYVNNAVLTAEKFVAHPFESEGVLYRTGDRGRWLPDGTLAFTGRKDSQVKVRGFRVETGEIEQALARLPAVRAAAVVPRPEGNHGVTLVAFLTTEAGTDWQQIREELRRTLPAYLIPDHFVVLDALPLTPNKKVDRKKLLAHPLLAGPGNGPAPTNETEAKLLTIWREVLGVDGVGIFHNFFELGGHSLKAMRVIARIADAFGVSIPLQAFFAHPTIAALAVLIGQATVRKYPPVRRAPPRKYHRLSYEQQRLWILNQYRGGQEAYAIREALRLSGPWDAALLEEAFNWFIQRTDALRTGITTVKGQPRQMIHPFENARLHLGRYDLRDRPDQPGALAGLLAEPSAVRFRLDQPPLIKAALVQLQAEESLLLITLPHIAADGWSLGMLTKAVIGYYVHVHQTGQPRPGPVARQYVDYVAWQQQFLDSPAGRQQEAYWTGVLAEPVLPLQLPFVRQRPAGPPFEGRRLAFEIPPDRLAVLRRAAESNRLTLNQLLFALYAVWLHKLSGQDTFNVGTLTAGRPIPALETIFGLFGNYLPVRCALSPGEALLDNLRRIAEQLLNVYENQHFPLERLRHHHAGNREATAGGGPSYNTMLVFHNHDVWSVRQMNEQLAAAGLAVSDYPLPHHYATLDFKLDITEDADAGLLRCAFEYNTGLLAPETAAFMVEHFSRLTDTFAAHLLQPLAHFPALTDAERTDLGRWTARAGAPPASAAVRITATFVAQPFEAYLRRWSDWFGMHLAVEVSPYNQVFQTLLAEPDEAGSGPVHLLLIRFEDWLRDAPAGGEGALAAIEKRYGQLTATLEASGRRYWIGLLPAAEDGLPAPARAAVRELYARWQAFVGGHPRLHLVDFTSLAGYYGLGQVFDRQRDRLAHVPFGESFYAAAATHLFRNLRAHVAPPFKVIALDCDNTLWAGICGEVGPLGVQLTPGHLTLQAFLLQRQREGFLLTLVSKNNEEDVWDVFRQHPAMLLKKEHFAGWRINWGPKSANLVQLAGALNVGISSFCFLDDSGFECEEVASNCPEVFTLQLPEDPAQLAHFLYHVWAFDRPPATEEDLDRNRMYQQEQQRQQLKSAKPSLDAFIESLGLQVSFTPLAGDETRRAAQLTQRTNQFNFSTRRRSEPEIEALGQQGKQGWSIRVADHFGTYGFTGLVITEIRDGSLYLDTFLLSCRVLGRNVEYGMLTALQRYCRENGIGQLTTHLVRSGKNQVAADFLDQAGWVESDGLRVLAVERIAAAPFLALHYGQPLERQLPAADPGPGETAGERVPPAAGAEAPGWTLPPLDTGRLLHQDLYKPLQYWRTDAFMAAVPPAPGPEQEPGAGWNETEKKLATLWRQVLHRTGVTREANFFEAGGSSLQAVTLMALVYQAFKVEIDLGAFFETPTLAALAERIGQKGKKDDPIRPVPRQEWHEASHGQKRLWFIYALEEDKTLYNIPVAVILTGPVDYDAFDQAVRAVVERHEILRTTFGVVEGVLHQRVHPTDAFRYWQTDAPGGDPGPYLQSQLALPFDLQAEPPFRLRLVPLGPGRHLCLLNVHHIAADEWSVQVLLKEFSGCYNAARRGESPALPPLPIQYRDYSHWHNALQRSAKAGAARAYWLDVFSRETPVLPLPADFGKTSQPSYQGSRYAFALDGALAENLRGYARQQNSTVFITLLAAVDVLLYRYTMQREIVVGIPAANRTHPQLHDQIGFYVNTLAVLTNIAPEDSFAALSARVRERVVNALEHQLYPFDRLVEDLKRNRGAGPPPLFNVMVQLRDRKQLPGASGLDLDGLRAEAVPMPAVKSLYALSFVFEENADGITGYLEYQENVFLPATVARLARHLTQLLAALLGNPVTPVGRVAYLSAEDHGVLDRFGKVPQLPGPYVLLPQLVEQQARQHPAATAFYFEDQEFTYGAVNARANAVAASLREYHQAGPEVIIGVLLDRSPDLIFVLLGILKSGAAYLPIDPAYPAKRVAFMLEHSRVGLLVLGEKHRAYVPPGTRFVTPGQLLAGEAGADNPPPVNQLDDLAYVLFTSGTTGHPKGVQITHRNLAQLMVWARHAFGADDYQTVFAGASYCFDFSVFEIFHPLSAGKSFRLLPSSLEAPVYLPRHRKVMLNVVPSVAAALLQEETDFSAVTVLNVAGEAVPVNFRRQLDYRRMAVRNLYGPTEDTVFSTCYRFSDDSEAIPIGKPLPGKEICVLDDNLQLLPAGVTGQVCIAGEGLSRGYLHNETLTAEKFIPHPYRPGSRLYLTGDLARWLPSGDLLYEGRKDQQVKVRGYRIELEEIENNLLQYPGVQRALLDARRDHLGVAHLVAYYTGDAGIPAGKLEEHLRGLLPGYMIPKFFVPLGAFALNPNGKIDRAQLPDPLAGEAEAEVPPATDCEKQLAGIWQDLLGVGPIHRHSDFFALGGHSIAAVSVAARIKKRFNRQVSAREIFNRPVLAELASYLEKAGPDPLPADEPVETAPTCPASSAQKRMFVMSLLDNGTNYNVSGALRVGGNFDYPAFRDALAEVMRRQESLRTYFVEADGEVGQAVAPVVAPPLTYRRVDREDEVIALVKAFQAPFDLTRAPLFRVQVIEKEAGTHILLFDLHHSICDGVSLEILWRELFTLYRGEALPPVGAQYRAYTRRQLAQKASAAYQVHKQYWLENLRGELPVLALPLDRPRPERAGGTGARLVAALGPEPTRAVRELAHGAKSSVFIVLLSILKITLAKYSGQEELLVGMATAGRNEEDYEHVIGMFVNTVVLRSRPAGHKPFPDYLLEIREATLAAIEHQDYQFEELVQALGVLPAPGRNPLFDVMVGTLGDATAAFAQSGLDVGHTPYQQLLAHNSQVDLSLDFIDAGGEIQIFVQYDAHLFNRPTIEQLIARFSKLIAAITAHPDQPLDACHFYEPDEERMLQLCGNVLNAPPLTLGAALPTATNGDKMEGLARVLSEAYGVTLDSGTLYSCPTPQKLLQYIREIKNSQIVDTKTSLSKVRRRYENIQ